MLHSTPLLQSSSASASASSTPSTSISFANSPTPTVLHLNEQNNPLISFDYITNRNGTQTRVTTFHNCISALKEYENRSLEELRWEDYILNKKYPQVLPPQQQSRTPIAAMPTPTATPTSSTQIVTTVLPVLLASSSSLWSSSIVASPQFIFSPQLNIMSSFNSNNHAFSSSHSNNVCEGTIKHKYKSTPGADFKQTSSKSIVYCDTSLVSINHMIEYENKSFDELRYEDYRMGNKCPKDNIIKSDESKNAETKPKIEPNEELETVCPICLETVAKLKKQNVRLMSTMCGHIICKTCTTSMFKAANNSKRTIIDCPTCRKKLNSTSIHDLFL